jgi:hypothetical protein
VKKKVTNIVLGVVVIAIWAVFIKGVMKGLDDNGGDIIPAHPAVQNTPFNDYELKRDTARLASSYRDPFNSETVTAPKDTARSQFQHLKSGGPVIAKLREDLSFIKYSGFIYNPGSKTTISVININGKNVMVADGEVTDGVKLIKNFKDSIKISYHNKIRFISKT